MINSDHHFEQFVDWLPELQRDEVYFVSLAARNKYLTPEERHQYGLGRTEMFSRQVAYDKPGLHYVMQKLQASLSYRRTRAGHEIPRKALVVYMNVNPCSTIDAYHLFKTQMDGVLQESFHACARRGVEPLSFEAWTRIDRHLMNAIQKSRGRRMIVDIDIDTRDAFVLGELQEFLREHGVDFATVSTHGGYHILARKNTLGGFNLYEKLQELEQRTGSEVCINKNGMVPVPGTLQAQALVTFCA